MPVRKPAPEPELADGTCLVTEFYAKGEYAKDHLVNEDHLLSFEFDNQSGRTLCFREFGR